MNPTFGAWVEARVQIDNKTSPTLGVPLKDAIRELKIEDFEQGDIVSLEIPHGEDRICIVSGRASRPHTIYVKEIDLRVLGIRVGDTIKTAILAINGRDPV